MVVAKVLSSINSVIFGLVALAFARGPYSSFEQELWCRWGSLGLLFAAGLIPALIAFRWRQAPGWAATLLGFWCGVAGFVGLNFALLSGGGV